MLAWVGFVSLAALAGSSARVMAQTEGEPAEDVGASRTPDYAQRSSNGVVASSAVLASGAALKAGMVALAVTLKRFFRTPLASCVERVDLGQCSEQELDDLCGKLYAIHSKVFDGVSREAFEHYVIRSPAARTKLDIFKHRGDWVGYLAIHDFSVWIDGMEFIVRRGETGILPEYRKRNWATKKMAWDGVRLKLSRPTANIYVLGCFVNPAMYYSLARFMYELYPNPRSQTPNEMLRLMRQLAELFRLEPIEGENPFVRRVGWQVKERELNHERIMRSGHEEIEYYLALNPRYKNGYGLEVLFPLSMKNLALSFVNSVSLRSHLPWRIQR